MVSAVSVDRLQHQVDQFEWGGKERNYEVHENQPPAAVMNGKLEWP